MKSMKVAVLLAASMMFGCAAIPADMKAQQKEENKAMASYHKADKKAFRAGEAVKVAVVALTVTKVKKVEADKELIAAKEHLDEVLKK